jgi:Nucleotidyl transferase AbiEii toxin, Type IV TA system
VPSALPPLAELLAHLQRTFAARGVRWFLFDAQAAILHGVARLSADVDVTVDLGERASADLVRALAEAGFELRVADLAGFVEATRVLPFVRRASRIPVDVVLAGPGLEEQFFAGAQERVIGDARVPVVSAEDLVAMKVLAGRPRDLDDVVAILHARPRSRLATDPDHPEPARVGLGPRRPPQRTRPACRCRAPGRVAAEGLTAPLVASGIAPPQVAPSTRKPSRSAASP